MTERNSRRAVRHQRLRAAVEGLEIRRLMCVDHLAFGPTLEAAMQSASSLTLPGSDNELAPMTAPRALFAGATEPPAGANGDPDFVAMGPVAAAPGQVNGTGIFGGGIYGSTATSYTARADGLPILNSLPGAPFSVFLDFDGWSGNGYGGAQTWASYDTDGNAAVFNATEQAAIAEGWRRIASYFSPFNINVTTVQPPNGNNFSWSIISNSGGGYSYLQLGSYAPSAFNPSSDLLSRTSGILHEIGHNFSLQHQSIYDAYGTKTTEYRGQLDSQHGVIMGVDYSGTPPKWIYGHPANSASGAQDDLAVIAGKVKAYDAVGADGFRADDFGGSIATATQLPTLSGGGYGAFGIIERGSDVDAFKFDSAGGRYTITLTPDSPSALDGKLGIYDSNGTLVALSDDPTRIDNSVTVTLSTGTYYLLAQGHGNYDDIGAYELKAVVTSPVTPPTTNALPAPPNVATTLASGTGVTVAWDASAGATSYQVERSLDGVTFTTVATVTGTTYTDASPLGSLRYVYQVRAKDATGVSVASTPSAIVNRPSAVTGFRATQISNTQVVLDWLEPLGSGGETGFRVERSIDGGATFAPIGTVNPNILIFSNTGLTSGSTYQYRVVPTSSQGDGVASATISVTMRLPAVTGLAFTARQTTSLSFSWTDQAAETGYKIERSIDNSTWTTVTTTAADVTSYTNTGLTAASEYYYRVSAVDTSGQAGIPSTVIFTATPAATPPGAPWSSADIGTQAGVGATSFDSATGTYKIVSNGADVWGTSDQFRYTSQSITGDGTIIAKVATEENTSGWTKVGVMFRESTAANSRHAFMFISPSNGAAFQWRSATGGSSSNTNTTSIGGVSPVAPYWVKLTRVGNVFTGYASADGVTWTQVGTATITMASTIQVGLAGSSINSSMMNTSTLTNVTVQSANLPPVAANDSASTTKNKPVTISVLANDSDPTNDPISITGTTSPTRGTIVVNANGTITYTPNANTIGSDSFTYTISDGKGGVATATVSVNVTNTPPSAAADTATTPEDNSVGINVSSNDSDADSDALSVTAVTTPAHGSAVINTDGTVTYTPALNYNGPDSFTYTITDTSGATATATVSITVTPVNDNPTAVNDSGVTNSVTPVAINVLANDSDVDGDTLSVSSLGAAGHGTVAINPDGTLTYTPDGSYIGADSFSYTISDGQGGTSTANVAITINPANQPPTATADTATTNEDNAVTIGVLANDLDPDNDTLTVTGAGGAAHGTVFVNANGTITYTPAANYNGADAFTYTISDGRGGTATGNVSVTVNPVNDGPTVIQPASASTSTVTGKTVGLTVLGGDIDTGEASLTYTWSLASGPANVTFSASGTNAAKSVTATFAAAGTYSFNVLVTDPSGATATSSVSVTVVQKLTALAVSPSSATVTINGSVQLAAKATDQFGATMTQAVTWAVTSGTGSVSTAGLFKAPTTVGTNGATSIVTVTGGGLSATSSIKVNPTIPAAPSGLAATKQANRKVKLAWKDNATNETGYYVDTSTNGTTWTTIYTRTAVTGSGTWASYTTGSFTAGTRYFRVRAYNAGGTASSAIVTVTL